MKNNSIILELFNKNITQIFKNQKPLTLTELKNNNDNLTLNTDENNIFDGVIDIIVYAIGAAYKIQKLTQVYPVELANSEQEEKAIKRIISWNQERNLNTYNLRRELSFIIEEVYEGTYTPHDDSHEVSLKICDKYFLDIILNYQHEFKLTQQFFINTYKSFIELGKEIATEYEYNDFYYYLNKIMDANDLKGKKIDNEGKLVKEDPNFHAPETDFKKKEETLNNKTKK